MQTQRPTKLTVAATFELINGMFSLIWAALAVLILLRGGVIASLGRTPLTILALLFSIMGIVYVAFGLGLWQRRRWARTGSFIAGALGILAGLAVPIPLLSAILNLVMIILLRDTEVRAAFEEPEIGPAIWPTPAGVVEQEPGTTGDEWRSPTPYQEPTPVTYRNDPEYQPQRSVPRPQEQQAAKTQLMRRGPEHLAWLIPTTGPHAGTEFPLRDVTTVGRDGDNNIVLDDNATSGCHLRIRRQDDRFILHDQATTNGTIVNGEPTLRHELEDGDLIKIGNTTLLFMQITTQESGSTS